MELSIYDKNLDRKGTIENQTSVIWTRKYYEPGNFEIHAPITPINLKLLEKGNIVTKKGSVEAGVIESIENNENNNLNEITIRGRFLSSYMDRRLIKETLTFSGTVEEAMRKLFEIAEPIPQVELGSLIGFSEKISFQVTMRNLLSTQSKIAKGFNVGFRFRPDFINKKIIFELYEGIDRTLSQNINSRVIFSETYNNLNKAIYRWNDQLLKTFVIVGGEGEGKDRIYISVGGGAGLGLREEFIDAKDISSSDISKEEYIDLLTQRANEVLAASIISETVEYETAANVNFVYRKDYDLGDIVTIHKRNWGIKMNQRITEIQEVHENDGMIVIPVLGSPLPDTMDWRD